MARIEKQLEIAINNKFKIDTERYQKAGSEISAFCRTNLATRMKDITPELINKFVASTANEDAKEVCRKVFTEKKFDKIKRSNQKSLGMQLHERLSSLNCYNKDNINSYFIIQNDIKKVTMYVDLNKFGIYSPIRYFAYKETVNIFTKWMNQKYCMVKNINEITEQQIKEYLIDRKAENISRKGVEEEVIALYHLIFLKKLR